MNSVNTDVQNTQQGDDNAFERLLRQYDPLISALVAEFSKAFPSIDMSEDDLRQEAAIALYNAAMSYRADRHVSFGLYAKICIKNALSDYMRRSIERSVPHIVHIVSDYIEGCFADESKESECGPASPDEEPLNVIISNESFRELRQSIKEALTDYEYSVLMCRSEGMTPAQISKKLGKSVKSVYDTVQRARNKLKKLIKQ